jgi:hypothetical protein
MSIDDDLAVWIAGLDDLFALALIIHADRLLAWDGRWAV